MTYVHCVSALSYHNCDMHELILIIFGRTVTEKVSTITSCIIFHLT